jgi:hypothetical protein
MLDYACHAPGPVILSHTFLFTRAVFQGLSFSHTRFPLCVLCSRACHTHTETIFLLACGMEARTSPHTATWFKIMKASWRCAALHYRLCSPWTVKGFLVHGTGGGGFAYWNRERNLAKSFEISALSRQKAVQVLAMLRNHVSRSGINCWAPEVRIREHLLCCWRKGI